PAHPLRLLPAGPGAGALAARRCGARTDHAHLGRFTAVLAGPARKDGDRPPDHAGCNCSGFADVRALRQETNKGGKSAQAPDTRQALQRAVRSRLQTVFGGSSQIGDDRIQMSATAGLPLALTIGEPAGIGPDLTLALWRRRIELDLPAFYLIADPDFLAARARFLGLEVSLAEVTPQQAATTFERALPVVPLGIPVTAAPGVPDASSAPAAIASIRRATADVLSGYAAGV